LGLFDLQHPRLDRPALHLGSAERPGVARLDLGPHLVQGRYVLAHRGRQAGHGPVHLLLHLGLVELAEELLALGQLLLEAVRHLQADLLVAGGYGHARLRELETPKSSFGEIVKERAVHWVTPKLVVQIQFSEWTRDGRLRHPVFVGLREDKKPRDCKFEIERRGGEVILRAPVRGLKMESGEIAGIRFDEGREESADAYILAVPHTALAELLPQSVKQSDPSLANLDKIKVAPITGVHFWFDRPVMKEPFVTLLDTTTQWIFNKTALYGRDSNGTANTVPAGQYLQLVISASYDLLQKPRQEIIDLCLGEVRKALPAARNAELLKATVIKEAAATFSPEPGVNRWRPRQQTSVPRLFLAGDWTETGWPATMEGAVRSGYLAAEALLRSEATPREFLQPDLPPDGFIAMWLGSNPSLRFPGSVS